MHRRTKAALFPNVFFACGGAPSQPTSPTPLIEEAFLDAVDRFDSKIHSSSPTKKWKHPGQRDQINFDREKPREFNVNKPPALSKTQIRHLRRMRTSPDESWYQWRMMPIWSLDGEDRVVHGVESLIRTAGSGTHAPWMDLVQLKHMSNRREYITWKLGEIQNAQNSMSLFPKIRRVFVNTLPRDFLDERFYSTLLGFSGTGIVLELDESKNSWPQNQKSKKLLFSRLQNLRDLGYEIALDDIGENPLFNNEFIKEHIIDFDYVKFSFQQCSSAFTSAKNVKTNGSDEWQRRRKKECKKIYETWNSCRLLNKDLKFVLEFSVTKALTEELGDLFPCDIWGSSEWFIQGGATASSAYPPSVFSGEIGKPQGPRSCIIELDRVCGWKKRNSFERAA